MQKFKRILAVPLAVLSLLLLTGASPAHAWLDSSTVTVSGTVTQCGGGMQRANINAVLDEQRHIFDTPLGQPPQYSVTFTNVPDGRGGWAWIVVDCSVTGLPQGHWVKVYRPLIGSDIHADL